MYGSPIVLEFLLHSISPFFMSVIYPFWGGGEVFIFIKHDFWTQLTKRGGLRNPNRLAFYLLFPYMLVVMKEDCPKI